MSFLENVHYQIAGNEQGHKLVFLHGLMGSGANWRRITPAFEAEYQILTFDQRGHGKSFHPPGSYRPDDYAEDLEKILAELGWERILLVGHSMGGRNALAFASRLPHKVITLVMEDIGPDANPSAIAQIEELLSLVPTPFDSRRAAKEFFDTQYPQLISHHPMPQTLARYFYSNIVEQPSGQADWRFAKEAILQSLRQGRTHDRWDQFAALPMPVLVVRGEKSTDLTPVVYARMLKELPHAVGREVPGAGHWVHFDQPDSFIAILKEFFSSLKQ